MRRMNPRRTHACIIPRGTRGSALISADVADPYEGFMVQNICGPLEWSRMSNSLHTTSIEVKKLLSS